MGFNGQFALQKFPDAHVGSGSIATGSAETTCRMSAFHPIPTEILGFGICRNVPILLQKSAITMREDCLDLLTRLPTMPLLASGSAPTRDLAPLWLGKACIERWWRSSDQFCEAA